MPLPGKGPKVSPVSSSSSSSWPWSMCTGMCVGNLDIRALIAER